MLAGSYKGQPSDLIKGPFEMVGQCTSGKITEEELEEIARTSCPDAAAGAGMYTANTMNCLQKCWVWLCL